MTLRAWIFVGTSLLAACSQSGSDNDGGGGRGGAAGTGGAAGEIACTLDGGPCPVGYRCGCGGPGPAGNCTCHKECRADSECGAPNPMCGCSPSEPAPRICVNLCFCSCD